jgi:hypothetical protein
MIKVRHGVARHGQEYKETGIQEYKKRYTSIQVCRYTGFVNMAKRVGRGPAPVYEVAVTVG